MRLCSFTYKTDEPFGKLFADWKASSGSIDAHEAIVAALDGAESTKYGAFKTGSVASKYDYRSQVIKKNLKFQVLMLYALHEVEAAVAKYKAKKPEADIQYAFPWGCIVFSSRKNHLSPVQEISTPQGWIAAFAIWPPEDQ